MVFCGLPWSSVVLYSPLWSFVVFYNFEVIRVLLWSFVVLRVLLWSFVVLSGPPWPFLVARTKRKARRRDGRCCQPVGGTTKSKAPVGITPIFRGGTPHPADSHINATWCQSIHTHAIALTRTRTYYFCLGIRYFI